jgi:hypothetical protein
VLTGSGRFSLLDCQTHRSFQLIVASRAGIFDATSTNHLVQIGRGSVVPPFPLIYATLHTILPQIAEIEES